MIFPSLYNTTDPPTSPASRRARAADLRKAASTPLSVILSDCTGVFLSCMLTSPPLIQQYGAFTRIVVHRPLIHCTVIQGLKIEPSFVIPPNDHWTRYVVPPGRYPLSNPGYGHVGSWQLQENQPDPIAPIPPSRNQPSVTAAAQRCLEGEVVSPSRVFADFRQHQPASPNLDRFRAKRAQPRGNEVRVDEDRAVCFVREIFHGKGRLACPVRASDDQDLPEVRSCHQAAPNIPLSDPPFRPESTGGTTRPRTAPRRS